MDYSLLLEIHNVLRGNNEHICNASGFHGFIDVNAIFKIWIRGTMELVQSCDEDKACLIRKQHG
jgi:phage anti-repressor protein